MIASIWALVPDDRGWGDYGRILLHGMASRRRRVDGRAQLERTGPYVPRLTLPSGAVVVTADLRAELESMTTALAFGAIDKVHIARLDWQSWDPRAPKPAEYPRSGEPEDYVLGRPHDAATAAAMPDLFELVPPRAGRGTMRVVTRVPRSYEFSLDLGATDAPPLFHAENLRFPFVSARVRELLASREDCACRFESVGPR
jgi:hypothetical protein